MAPNQHSPEIMPLELDLEFNNIALGDKSPKKPRRQISVSDLHESTPPGTPTSITEGKSTSPGVSTTKRKLKKKKKSMSIANHSLPKTSNHSNASSGKKKKKSAKKKHTKKKKKKKKSLSMNNMDDDDEVELPLNDEIIAPDSPHRLPGKRRRKKKSISSRLGGLQRHSSEPTLNVEDSDGDSTLEGSWCGGAASFSNFNDWHGDLDDEELSPRTKAKNKMPFEIEAFLDQIINDASKPKSPITSIRKKARGRTLKKKGNDKERERHKSASHLDDDDEFNQSGKKKRSKEQKQRCNSTGDRVVSLSIAGEGEKTFTLSGDDIGMIEAFLQNKTKDKQQQDEPATSPTRSQASSKKHRHRSTSASRAAKRAEIFDTEQTNADGGGLATAVKRRSISNSIRLASMHSHADSLLDSERIEGGHQQAAMLPQTRLARQMRRMSGGHLRGGGRMVRRMSGGYVSKERPRSKSVEADNNWREIHANRLSLLELESFSDGEEGSYSLNQGRTVRRWSFSDSTSLSSQGLLDNRNVPPTEGNRVLAKDLDINGPFNVVKAPRRGRKPGDSDSNSNLGFDSMDDDEIYTDVPKRRTSPASPEVEAMSERVKRRSRSGGRRPRKFSGHVPKSLVGEDDEDEEIVNSPGIFKSTVAEKLLTDDEDSNIEQSGRGQTLEQLMMSSENVNYNSPKTPSIRQRETKHRGSKTSTSTPNGAHIYKLDLGEARWTTTPTGLKGKNRHNTDPLDLQLPFSEETGGRPSGILKTSALGLLEPATFRNSAIRNKKRLKKRGIEEGDILVCDDDNATLVSDITEAIDASLRSTFSTSVRSSDHDDYEEPLRDKWQPNIEQIAETNSQSEFGSTAGLSAASPSDLKEDESATTQATPRGTKRFSLKKLFKKK